MRWLWSLLCAALLGLLVCTAHGQEVAAPPPEQVALYLQGLEAYDEGRYDVAIERFGAAWEHGELNVVALAMGRALFASDSCAQAAVWYERALTAPAVAAPSPEKVASRVEDYQRDLQSTCPGELIIHCEPADLRVAVGGEEPRACSQAARTLPAGVHAVRGVRDEDVVETTVQILGGGRVEMTLQLPRSVHAPAEASQPASEPQAAPDEIDPWAAWAWGLGATGLTVLAGSVLLDLTLLEVRADRYAHSRAAYLDAPTTAGYDLVRRQRASAADLRTGLTVSYVVAGAFLLVGGGLGAVSHLQPDTAVSLVPTQGGAMVMFHLELADTLP
jgi:hypothetical protein